MADDQHPRYTIQARVSPDQYQEIKSTAGAAGMGVGTYMRHQITTCLLHMVHAALPPDTYRSIMEMAEAQDITVGEWVRDQLIDIVADARSTRGSGIRK